MKIHQYPNSKRYPNKNKDQNISTIGVGSYPIMESVTKRKPIKNVICPAAMTYNIDWSITKHYEHDFNQNWSEAKHEQANCTTTHMSIEKPYL